MVALARLFGVAGRLTSYYETIIINDRKLTWTTDRWWFSGIYEKRKNWHGKVGTNLYLKPN